MPKSPVNYKAYLNSFAHAWEGLVYAFQHHNSFKVETITAVVVILVGMIVGLSHTDWAIVLLLIFSVLVAELLNTAVETALDYMAKEHHLDVKVAKDVSAGAVLLLSIGSVVLGIIIFWPYFVN